VGIGLVGPLGQQATRPSPAVFFSLFFSKFSKAFLNRILRANKFQQKLAAQVNKDAPA